MLEEVQDCFDLKRPQRLYPRGLLAFYIINFHPSSQPRTFTTDRSCYVIFLNVKQKRSFRPLESYKFSILPSLDVSRANLDFRMRSMRSYHLARSLLLSRGVLILRKLLLRPSCSTVCRIYYSVDFSNFNFPPLYRAALLPIYFTHVLFWSFELYSCASNPQILELETS